MNTLHLLDGLSNFCNVLMPLGHCSTPEQARAVATSTLAWDSGAEVPFMLYHPGPQQHHTADTAVQNSSQHSKNSSQHITNPDAVGSPDVNMDNSQDTHHELGDAHIGNPASSQHSKGSSVADIQQEAQQGVQEDVPQVVQQQGRDVCTGAVYQQLIVPVSLLCLEGQHLQAVPCSAATASASTPLPLPTRVPGSCLKSAAGAEAEASLAAASAGLAGLTEEEDAPDINSAEAKDGAAVAAGAAGARLAGAAVQEGAPGTGSAASQGAAAVQETQGKGSVGEDDAAAGHDVTVLLWIHPAAVKTAWQELRPAAEARGVVCKSR